MIELGLIAERLNKGWYACLKPMQLIDYVKKEERFGLASVLDVKCSSDV